MSICSRTCMPMTSLKFTMSVELLDLHPGTTWSNWIPESSSLFPPWSYSYQMVGMLCYNCFYLITANFSHSCLSNPPLQFNPQRRLAVWITDLSSSHNLWDLSEWINNLHWSAANWFTFLNLKYEENVSWNVKRKRQRKIHSRVSIWGPFIFQSHPHFITLPSAKGNWFSIE